MQNQGIAVQQHQCYIRQHKKNNMIRHRSRRLRPSSSSLQEPVPALEDGDLLQEILLYLPPQPSYLLHASLVCKHWRRLATGPYFLRRFRLHHRRPPFLGVFSEQDVSVKFTSTLDPPCNIPSERFSLPLNNLWDWNLLGCRHGRVLLINKSSRQVIVWDPITNDHGRVDYPPEFCKIHTGAVLCAADDQGHVHGDCHSSTFKVVLLGAYNKDSDEAVTSVYSSETGLWCAVLPPLCKCAISGPSTLVGNTLYWLNTSGWLSYTIILAFELDIQRLTTIEKPSSINYGDIGQIIQAEDGGLGFAAFSCGDYHERCLEIWERNANSYGVATWVLRKSLILHKILGNYMAKPHIVHYVEDVHAIFIQVQSSIFMVQLESMKCKEILKSDYFGNYHPFTSFYTQGILREV